jgi:hypothetical protein
MTQLSREEIRLFKLIVTGLCHTRADLKTKLLLPSGAPLMKINEMLDRKVPKKLNKQELAEAILAELAEQELREVFEELVEYADGWSSFQLAEKPDVARGIVAQVVEFIRGRGGVRPVAPDTKRLLEGRKALLREFFDLRSSTNPQARGKRFEIMFHELCVVSGIPSVPRTVRPETRDEMDVLLRVGGRPWVSECKWEGMASPMRHLDAFVGKLRRAHDPTVAGLFLSVEGWVDAFPTEAGQAGHAIVLMHGTDFRQVLEGEIHLYDALRGKLAALTIRGPNVPVSDVLTMWPRLLLGKRLDADRPYEEVVG